MRAVAVIGSVARPLWKEIPRFRAFRRLGIEVWHECHDLDLAVWLDSQHRLGELRRARDHALRRAFEAGTGPGGPGNEVDVFLFEPGSDRYLVRLCKFARCPNDKRECLVPGCGAVAFNRVVEGFVPCASLLASARDAMLYRRGEGRLRSALDLPAAEADRPDARSPDARRR